MPIIDKTGKRNKYNYLVSGILRLSGGYSFEYEVEAEDEEDARMRAEEMAIEDLDQDSSPSEYHDSTEQGALDNLGEVVPDPVPSPALTFYASPTSYVVYNQVLSNLTTGGAGTSWLETPITPLEPTGTLLEPSTNLTDLPF